MNKSDVKDLTKGSLWTGVLFFSLPLIMSNLLQILFNMSDIAVVGHFSGPMALGAVGSTSTLNVLFVTFLIGTGAGINVITARAIGRRHEDDIRKTVHTAFLLSVLFGLSLLVFGEVSEIMILRLLRTKSELFAGAVLYLRIIFLGMPGVSIYNFGSAVFSAAGDTRKPLIFLSISGALNVLLNIMFVILFHMDVAGVGLATIISQYFSAICVLIALHRAQGPHSLHFRYMKLDHQKAKNLLKLCLPAGIQNSIFQVANLFVQYGVNTFDAITVAGNAAAQNADGLVYDTMAAFYTACGSFIGQNYGAGDKQRVKQSYLVSLTYSFGFGLALGLLLVAFGKPFLGLFTKDPAVMKAGMYRLTLMGIFYGFSALMDNTIAASRGLGYTNIPTLIVLLGSCVFRVAWIFTVFAFFKTITSLYMLYIFSWAITGIAEALYFRKIYKSINL